NPRLTFGILELYDGVGFIAIIIGLFGIAEVLKRLDDKKSGEDFNTSNLEVQGIFKNIRGMKKNFFPAIRGSIIGFLIGVLPGAGATTATFLTYVVEKKLSKTPEKFGTGVDHGISSPEASNNAAEAGSFVPLFSLGIPGSATSAVLLGALIMFGMQPGPSLFENSGPVIWAAIASILLGNIILLILNVGLIPMFIFLIKKSEIYILPIITVFSVVGIYNYYNNMFSVGIMIIFGILGYFMKKFDFPLTPFVLALVLGPLLEKYLRQALVLSNNNMNVFFTSPISAIFLIVTFIFLLIPVFRFLKYKNISK